MELGPHESAQGRGMWVTTRLGGRAGGPQGQLDIKAPDPTGCCADGGLLPWVGGGHCSPLQHSDSLPHRRGSPEAGPQLCPSQQWAPERLPCGLAAPGPPLSPALEVLPVPHAVFPPNILFVGKALRDHRHGLMKGISSRFPDWDTEAEWGWGTGGLSKVPGELVPPELGNVGHALLTARQHCPLPAHEGQCPGHRTQNTPPTPAGLRWAFPQEGGLRGSRCPSPRLRTPAPQLLSPRPAHGLHAAASSSCLCGAQA